MYYLGIDIGGTMKVCMYAADTIEFDGKRVNIDTPEIKAALLTLAKNKKLKLPKDLAKWPK